jgi:hypothetical protein
MGKIRKNTCALAIIKTLSYSGVFGYTLSFFQLTGNLITNQNFTAKKIRKELNRLIDSKVVRKTKGRYILKGIKSHDTQKTHKNSQKIIEENKPIIKTLSKIPWIKMIAVTGSVANYDAKEEDDIDLLFITEKNRLWITRGFVFLILKILRVLPKDTSERKICPNLFIDERNLSWAKKRRNLYVAQNIISTQPLIWRDDIYFDFINANKWIFRYYKNFALTFPNKSADKNKENNRLMKLIESIARKKELAYMKDSMTTEIANEKLIHFNKNDSSKKILKNYKSILKKVKKS